MDTIQGQITTFFERKVIKHEFHFFNLIYYVINIIVLF